MDVLNPAIEHYSDLLKIKIDGKRFPTTPDTNSFFLLSISHAASRTAALSRLVSHGTNFEAAAEARAVFESVVIGLLVLRGSATDFKDILLATAHDREKWLIGQVSGAHIVPKPATPSDAWLAWLISGAGGQAPKKFPSGTRGMTQRLDKTYPPVNNQIGVSGLINTLLSSTPSTPMGNRWEDRYVVDFSDMSIGSHGGGNSMNTKAQLSLDYDADHRYDSTLSLHDAWHWLHELHKEGNQHLRQPTDEIDALADAISEAITSGKNESALKNLLPKKASWIHRARRLMTKNAKRLQPKRP